MKPIFILLTLLHLLSEVPTVAASMSPDESCEYFFCSLKTVPREKLTRTPGEYESFFDGERYFGCEVKLVTNTRLVPDRSIIPNFYAQEGSDLYRDGWRMNKSYAADGPGSSVIGIEKGIILCLIMDDQPAYLDKSGEIIQSDTINIVVQCRSAHD